MITSKESEQAINREANFSDFMNKDVQTFWQLREEWGFLGVDQCRIQCIRFIKPEHNKVIVIVNGIMDCYVRYTELAYDLFQNGYDVMMFDHRGQGYSDRILPSPKRVYIENFSDYVDDLEAFWQQFVLVNSYQKRYLIGHSMGGAITTLFLARNPEGVNSVVLAAPMLGINLPLPMLLIKQVLTFTERRALVRSAYAAYQRRHFPFQVNLLTHSRVRHDRLLRYYADDDNIHMHGPTWHWVAEAIKACEQIHHLVECVTTPICIFEAGQEKIVSNKAMRLFHRQLMQKGLQTETPWLKANDKIRYCNGDGFISFHLSRHDIFIENDETRNQALKEVFNFFEHY